MNLLQRFRLARARRACGLPLQQRLLHQPLLSPGARVADVELVALDFETTGLDVQRDHIIAIDRQQVGVDQIRGRAGESRLQG